MHRATKKVLSAEVGGRDPHTWPGAAGEDHCAPLQSPSPRGPSPQMKSKHRTPNSNPAETPTLWLEIHVHVKVKFRTSRVPGDPFKADVGHKGFTRITLGVT